jgi:TrmH RNA methyltransferase
VKGPFRGDAEQVHGLRAGLAVFTLRPDDVVRVAYAHAVRHEIARLARWAEERGVACAAMGDKDLDRLAESTHHEGLCVWAKPRKYASAQDVGDALARTRRHAIALDRVRNPYNVGAIVRSAAFFGLEGVYLGAPAPHAGLTPTAVRVAEGGAEQVRVARTTDLADTLSRLRARGVRVVGADGHARTAAGGFDYRGPLVVVLGNEREGLGDRVRAQCDKTVAVIGSGRIESLNVAVVAGVLMAEMTRAN